MAIPIVNSRDLVNTWRILDDKLGTYGGRGLPFKFPYVGSFSQSVAEWFIKVYSNPGDTIAEPFGGRGTTAMQALFSGRNIIINDLSSYSNVLCHSVLYTPYMKDVLSFIDTLETYIREDITKSKYNISTDYAGKGSENDVAKIYCEDTFARIIRLRNLLNDKNVLLGIGDNNLFVNTEWDSTYRHEIVLFTRMIMSQLILYGSRAMSFNGMPTRGADNTNIKSILRFYNSLEESPTDVDIFERMRYYVNKMGLDELDIRDKFSKLERKLISCDARNLALPNKCADMVVTSPPYYANLNYGMANWLRIFMLGGVGDPLVIKTAGKIDQDVLEKKDNSEIYGKTYDKITDSAGGTIDSPNAYSNFTGQYLKELYRILKDDAVAIIVVGDYGNKKKVEAWKLVADRAVIFGFKPVMVIMDELNKKTKSSTQFSAKAGGGKNDYDVAIVLYKGSYVQKNKPEDIDFRWGANFVDKRQRSIDDSWG